LHRHSATRTRIAVTRNDPEEITLSLFLVHRFDSEMRAALTCFDTSRRPTALAAPQAPTLRREQRASGLAHTNNWFGR
jgi:hypothetical protein